MKYMKQLDSLRAIAVAMVLYTHFYAGKTAPLLFFKNTIEWGGIGVGLFFVLSGYLITNILLKNKIDIENGSETVLSCIKTFFVRRSLRIFPIYYLAIFIALSLGIKPVRETLMWLVTYSSNFYFAQIGKYDGSISHLWSLAVEEQFYLIWPWVILLTPKKYLLRVLFVVVAIGPLFQHICSILNINSTATHVMTFRNMDAFGMGGILAYMKIYKLESEKTEKIFSLLFIVSGTLFIEALMLYALKLPNTVGGLFTIISSTFYMCLIKKCSEGIKGFVGSILNSPVLIYIGKISYGIYLYHFFVMYVIPMYFKGFHELIASSLELQALAYTIITLIVSSVSWFAVEKPILSLKNRQPHRSIVFAPNLE